MGSADGISRREAEGEIRALFIWIVADAVGAIQHHSADHLPDLRVAIAIRSDVSG